MRSFEIFQQYEKTLWQLKDIPWDQLDRKNLEGWEIDYVRAAVMGEATFLGGLHTFLNEAVDDYDFSCFASIWSNQELQHHIALRTWLKALDADVDQAPVDAMRPPFPVGNSLAQTLCTNVVSELLVCHMYHHISDRIKDPVLALILRNASGDEGRHAQGFAHYAKRRLKAHPEELVSVLETLYFYTGNKQLAVRHPSSVFKGELPPELGKEHVTIDVGLDYFYLREDSQSEALRQRIFRTFSTMTGLTLDSPRSIRKAIGDALRNKRETTASAELVQ